MTNYTKRVLSGVTMVFLVTLIGAVMGYVFRIVLARNLSVEQYGLFYAVYALFSIIFVFRDVGLGQAMIKFVPEFYITKKLSKIKSTLLMVLSVNIIISLILSLVVILLSNKISQIYLKDSSAAIIVSFFAVVFFFFSLEAFCVNVLTAFQKHFSYSFFQFLRQFLALAIVFLLFSLEKSLFAPIYAYILASFIFLTIFLIYYINKVKPLLSEKSAVFEKELLRKLFLFGMPVIFISIGGLILQFTDTIMLTFFTSTKDAGVYNAAVPIANILIYLSAALATVLMPLVSELRSKKFHKHLKKGISLIYKYSFFLLLPFVFLVFSFSEFIILILFGEQYIAGSLALKIIIFGTFLFLFAQINFSILSGAGRPDLVAKLTIAGAIFNILLNFLLIPFLGILGAAISTSAGYFMMAMISFISARNKISFNISFVYMSKVVLNCVLMLFLIYYMKHLINTEPLLEAGIILLISGLFYLLISMLMKLIDINEIKEIILDFRRK